MSYIKTLWNLYCLRNNVKKSKEEVKMLQDRKLRNLLHHVWDYSAYYRRTFKRAGISEKDLDTLPLSCFPTIDKKTLLEYFNELVTVPGLTQEGVRAFDEEGLADRKPYLGKYHVVHSSGSTGKPGYFVYDETAWNEMLLGIIRGALWDMSMGEIASVLAC